MSSFAILLVGLIAAGPELLQHSISLLLGMGTVFLITGAGNVINDYYDREVDKINHPERPIPAGEIAPSTAVIYAAVLFGMGILLAYLISTCALLIAAYAVFVLLLYESSLKYEGFVGNVAVSILVGMLFVFGGIIFGKLYLMVVFAFMSALANLGREIIKDVEDMGGDINRKTLPKKIGRRKAALVALASLVLAVALSPIPYVFFSFSLYYLIFVAVSDGIFIYAALIQFKDPHRGQKMVKYGMLAGLGAYLIGGLT
ncbi:MAG: UbiA family prenyltransferase [Euryarchaeota archaeon]|nr:UbiA family prenyltransferase [Euryarchaeota archaeon]